MSSATPHVDAFPIVDSLSLTFLILLVLFPLANLGIVLLVRNNKSIPARALGVLALFLGGLGLTINMSAIIMFVALHLSGAATFIGVLDLLVILGVILPTLYIGYYKLKEKGKN